jgi:hypothetical protein
MQIVNKQVNLNLVGLDGNAFSLMGAFKQQARKEKWTPEEIEAVMDECMNGDYDHLLVTLSDHCNMNDKDYDQDEEDYDDDDDYEEDELVDALVGKFISEEEAGIIKQFIRNQ